MTTVGQARPNRGSAIERPLDMKADRKWLEQAKCRASKTPDAWFGEWLDGPPANFMPHSNPQDRIDRWRQVGAARAAELLCEGCPVMVECLAFALANDIREGVWGGVSPWRRTHELRHKGGDQA